MANPATQQRFVLAHHRSPGDIMCLTALVRDIKLTYGDNVLVDVDTTCLDLWRHNPYLTKLWDKEQKRVTTKNVTFLKMSYGEGIRQQKNETMHFAAYFHRDFKKQTGIQVPVHYAHGDLHLSPEEREQSLIEGRYWVLLSGGKSDAPVKVWRSQYFQQVVDWLGDQGLGAVQLGSVDKGHWHPQLDGTLNLVGQTNLRDMLRLIYHADGVICGVTAAMHMAAALHRPCVCIAGGREAWWWEAYVNENRGFAEASGSHPMPHRFLHTIGQLDCCRHHGCWKNKVVPLNNDKLICQYPIMHPDMPIAKCMDLIQPHHVIEAIMQYYEDKSLPPVRLGNAPAASELSVPKAADAPAKVQTTCGNPQQSIKTRTSAKLVVPKGMPIKINPRTKMETRGAAKAQEATVVPQRPGVSPQYADESVFDHPQVGGKFTVFTLLYGPQEYHDLHRRCLEAIVATIPHSRLDLRIATAAANQNTLNMVQDYLDKGFATKHYRHNDNPGKYLIMREMFYDPAHPITTKWLLWFDDDSICDVEQGWLNVLARHIVQHHATNNQHMMGARFTWTPTARQWEIMASRPWWQGRPHRLKNGDPSPSGQHVVFGTGGFWALTTEAMRRADIPDLGTGLTHNGGDWQIGEQLWQAGYNVKQFNGRKQFVRTSSVARRGVTVKLIDELDNDERQRLITQSNELLAQWHSQAAEAPRTAAAIPPQPKVAATPPRMQIKLPPPAIPTQPAKQPPSTPGLRVVEL